MLINDNMGVAVASSRAAILLLLVVGFLAGIANGRK